MGADSQICFSRKVLSIFFPFFILLEPHIFLGFVKMFLFFSLSFSLFPLLPFSLSYFLPSSFSLLFFILFFFFSFCFLFPRGCATQSGEEKAPGRFYGGLPVERGPTRKLEIDTYIREASSRTRNNDCKLSQSC